MASDPRARYRVVAVVVEVLTWDAHHWCRTCQLGSGIRAWVAVRTGDRMHLQQRVWCDECGGRNIEIRADGCD